MAKDQPLGAALTDGRNRIPASQYVDLIIILLAIMLKTRTKVNF